LNEGRFHESKDGKDEKVFDALEWLAAMTSHLPNKGEQMVRYYGHYGNASRRLQKRKTLLIPKRMRGGVPPYLVVDFF